MASKKKSEHVEDSRAYAARKPAAGSPDRRSAKRRAPGGVDRFMTAFRLRTDLKAWLEARAEKNGRTMSAEIEAILLDAQGRGEPVKGHAADCDINLPPSPYDCNCKASRR